MDESLKKRIVAFYLGGIFNALIGLYLLIEGVPFLDPGTVRILAVAFLVFALVDFVIPRVIRKGWEARAAQQAGEKQRSSGPVTKL